MQRRVELVEVPKDILFSLKDITYSPESPRLEEPFTVRGKVELFKIPFLAPIWVIAKVTAPETWWEHYIPIWGSPTVGEGDVAIGGEFEISFPTGFDRDGEFLLRVELHAGPTYTVDKTTLPPFPPLAYDERTFLVAGEIPPEEVGFKNFRIVSYSKNGGPSVTPPGVLELEAGDRCRVNVGFDHREAAVTGKFHAAIWQARLWDPHDEVLNADKAFSAPSSVDWQPFEHYIDIPITSAISPGSEYGLYVKIMGITGGDIFTEYLANVITISGPPPTEADLADWDFKPTKGTYDPGAKIPFTADYKYRGINQAGQLTISIGTGVFPTFNSVYTYAPIPVGFEGAADWQPHSIEGNITLPDVLEPGQTYSLQAKLEALEVKTEEIDTDWSAFTIRIGPPASDIADWDFRATWGTFDLGARVAFTADYKYKGKAQGGQLTISLGTGGYPSFFTKHTFSPVSVSFAEAMDWTPGQLTGTFELPTTLEPGQIYNVRAKLETADRAQETNTDWEVITIAEAPPKADIADFDLKAAKGTYRVGDRVSFSAPYKYKGVKQSGQLVLELGTGVYPAFYSKVIYSPMPVAFEEAMDWESRSLEGTFLLTEALEPGQTYSVRAKLETLVDKAQETDTDWGVITIEEVGEYTLTILVAYPAVGWVSKSPDKPKYAYGEIVTLTANLDAWAIGSYVFDYWDKDGVYLSSYSPVTTAMLADITITAHFRKI